MPGLTGTIAPGPGLPHASVPGGSSCNLAGAGRGKGNGMRNGCMAAVAALVLAACATEASYAAYANSFVGKSATELYGTWGAPLRYAPVPGGGQVVSYLTNVNASLGFGIQGCETSFVLSETGIVTNASFRGANCIK